MSENTPAPDGTQDRTSERILARECEWCGATITLNPRAQHQKYCSRGCRQRGYEVRTAQKRQQNDRAAGTARHEGPVREVVERHTVRNVRRGRPAEPIWQPPRVERVEVEVPVEVPVVASPHSAREAADFMAVTAACISEGTIALHDHKRVYQGVRALLRAFDKTHPGGLEHLMGERR